MLKVRKYRERRAAAYMPTGPVPTGFPTIASQSLLWQAPRPSLHCSLQELLDAPLAGGNSGLLRLFGSDIDLRKALCQKTALGVVRIWNRVRDRYVRLRFCWINPLKSAMARLDNASQAPVRGFSLARLTPYFLLVLWALPLYLLQGEQQSLMAFDEVYYAQRARTMLETDNWINPWLEPHHKTPGYYWLVAISFQIFGINESAARLPNLMAGILATLVLYEIGKLLFNNRVAFLSALILNVQFIWMQYCRLSAPDIPMTLLVLAGIWFLLRSELSSSPPNARLWRFCAGLVLGLGFLIRSYVALLPVVALLPYLLLENRRHKHLFQPIFFLGLGLGFSATGFWLLWEWMQFDLTSLTALFGFSVDLATQDRHAGGWFYYFWNLPANSFPWSVFAIFGAVLLWLQPASRYRTLYLGYPIVLLLEISAIGTRTPRYSLAMYPFLALYAGFALHWLMQKYTSDNLADRKIVRRLGYFLAGFGGVLAILGLLQQQIPTLIPDIEAYLSQTITYSTVAWGVAWTSAVAIERLSKPGQGVRIWMASILIGPWLALACANSTGLLGDYNADIKAFVRQQEIATILQRQEVDFIDANREFKNKRLFHFYTPSVGRYYGDFQQAAQERYVWVKVTEENQKAVESCQAVGKIRGWHLVYVEKNCNQL